MEECFLLDCSLWLAQPLLNPLGSTDASTAHRELGCSTSLIRKCLSKGHACRAITFSWGLSPQNDSSFYQLDKKKKKWTSTMSVHMYMYKCVVWVWSPEADVRAHQISSAGLPVCPRGSPGSTSPQLELHLATISGFLMCVLGGIQLACSCLCGKHSTNRASPQLFAFGLYPSIFSLC